MAIRKNRTVPSAGQLDKAVSIFDRYDVESGSYSANEVVTESNTVWARIVNATGTAQVDSRNSGTSISHRITIRFRYDVSVKKYLLYQDATGDKYRYEIQTIQKLCDDGNQFMQLECMQLEKDGTYSNPSPEDDE